MRWEYLVHRPDSKCDKNNGSSRLKRRVSERLMTRWNRLEHGIPLDLQPLSSVWLAWSIQVPWFPGTIRSACAVRVTTISFSNDKIRASFVGFKWERFVETLFDEALVSRAEIERVLSILMKDDRRRGSLRVTISRNCIRNVRRKFSRGQLSPSETCSTKEDAPRWKRFPVAFLEIVRSRKFSHVFILV